MTETTAPMDGIRRVAGTPQAVVLLLATVLPVMGIVSLAPVMPKLLQAFADTPNSAILVPVALTVPALCIALLSPIAGVLADRWGRKTLLLIALVVYGLAGMAPLGLDSLQAIIASRVVLGMAEAVIMTVTTTLTGDYFHGPSRQKWIAVQAALGSFSASVLFLVGGLLGSIGWRAPFVLYALAFLVLVAAFALLWEPRRDEGRFLSSTIEPDAAPARFPWKALAGICGLTVISALIFYVVPIQLGLVAGRLGITEPAMIGAITAGASLAVPVGAIAYARLNGRLKAAALLMVSLVLAGVGLAGMALATTTPLLIAATVLNQFGCGIMLPTLIAWSMSLLPFTLRGRGMGAWTSAFFIGQFLSPLATIGLSHVAGGLTAALLILGGVGAAAGIICGLVVKNSPRLARDEVL